MSSLIAWMLIILYCLFDKPEMIIAAGLFGIAAEISCLFNKIIKKGEIDG